MIFQSCSTLSFEDGSDGLGRTHVPSAEYTVGSSLKLDLRV